MLLEARPYRPFKSSEEYLYAMKEDLAEWLNALYPELRINVDNFMDRLDTGVALCKVCIIYFIEFFSIFFTLLYFTQKCMCVRHVTLINLAFLWRTESPPQLAPQRESAHRRARQLNASHT